MAIDTAVMGGLWHTVGERFDIPRSLISILGDRVIVDSSVPDAADAMKLMKEEVC